MKLVEFNIFRTVFGDIEDISAGESFGFFDRCRDRDFNLHDVIGFVGDASRVGCAVLHLDLVGLQASQADEENSDERCKEIGFDRGHFVNLLLNIRMRSPLPYKKEENMTMNLAKKAKLPLKMIRSS